MKKYHVYGLGNALLDIEIEVKEDELTAMNLDKGVMTLIEKEFQQEILDYFSDKEQLNSCGGSAANTMITINQLGCNSYYSCKVADDQNGKIFANDLVSNGVDTNLTHQSLSQGVTGRCLALVTPDAERTMYTHLGTTIDFSVNEIDKSALLNSQSIYIEGYLVASPSAREAAVFASKLALDASILKTITLSDPNMVKFFKDGLLEMIGSGVDVLFCNETEAKIFSNTNDLKECCDYLKTLAKTFVITQGGKGALLFDGVEFHQIKGVKVDVIDTLGAGDAFAGAYLATLLKGGSEVQAAMQANKVAAKVVTHFGARLKELDLAMI